MLEEKIKIIELENSIKKNKRKIRLAKLLLLTSFYNLFRDIHLKECILKSDNDYTEAEKLSYFINSLGLKSKPTDFIYKEDDVVDKLIDKNIQLKKSLVDVEKVNIIKSKTVLAFCKNIEFGEYHPLKCNIQFYYQVSALYNYIEGNISKVEAEQIMMEYSLFGGNPIKAYRKIRNTILEIEKTINRIENLQKERFLSSILF